MGNVGGSYGFRAVLGVALTGLVCAETPARGQNGQSWIELLGGGKYQLVDDGTMQTLPIPLSLTNVRPDDVTLRFVAVSLDNVVMPRLAHAFAVTNTLAGSGPGVHHLSLDVETNGGLRPGIYDVSIEALTSDPSKFAPRMLNVRIEHPGAKLQAPRTIYVERRIWVPETLLTAQRATVEATPLTIDVTSTASRVSQTELGAIRFTIPHDLPITGSIALQREIGNIESRKSAEVPWRFSGTFPLGTVEADTEITAPQLKDAVPLKIKITSRLALPWLWGAAIAGLATGWLLRVRLSSYLQLRQARLDALTTLRRTDEAISRYPDRRFREALRDTRADLRAAARTEDATDIATKIKAAQDALSKATTDLLKRQQDVKSELESLRSVFKTDRELPEPLREIIVNARNTLTRVDAMLATDAAGASLELDALKEHLKNEINKEVRSWQVRMVAALDALVVSDTLLLPRNVANQVATAAERTGNDLKSVMPVADMEAKTIDDLFRAIDKIRRQMRESFVESTALGLDNAAQAAHLALSSGWPAQSPLLRQLVTQTAAISRKLRSCLDAPERAIDFLMPGKSVELEALDSQWQKVVRTPSLDEEMRNIVEGLIKSRNYVDAALNIRNAQIQVQRDTGDARKFGREDTEPLNVEAIILPPDAETTVPDAAPAMPVNVTVLRSIPIPEELDQLDIQTRSEIRWAKALQTAAVGIAFLVVAQMTYAEKFVGTFVELVGIFFWAFGLDVTVERLLEFAKSAKGSPS